MRTDGTTGVLAARWRAGWGTLVRAARLVTLIRGAWLPGESVRAWLLLTGPELAGHERSLRWPPERGPWRAGVLARLRAGLLLAPARELALGELPRVLLLVRARRLGAMRRWGRRWSLRELPAVVLPARGLPGAMLSSHRHSGDAPLCRGRPIRVAALGELLLCLRTGRARPCLLLPMGARRRILPWPWCLRLALPARLGAGGTWPHRRCVARRGWAVLPGG